MSFESVRLPNHLALCHPLLFLPSSFPTLGSFLMTKLLRIFWLTKGRKGLPWWLSDKESTCNAGDKGDKGSLPGSGWSPGGGNGNPLQHSCQENPVNRGAWQAINCRVAKSSPRLNNWACQEENLSDCNCIVQRLLNHTCTVPSHVRLCHPMPTRLLCPWDSPDKNIEVGYHDLLQGIFLTQESNPHVLCFLHWQTGSLPLSATWEAQVILTCFQVWIKSQA